LGILFISHSRHDNDAAIKVRNWLKEGGWGQAFLDLDPAHGLAPGHRWQQELKQAGERCSGVLILISPGWIASDWCRTEFLVADQLGKKIFPLFVAPTRFDDDLLRDIVNRFQFADVSTPENEAEGFERLAIGLKRAGLDPKHFLWPPPDEPQRPIYRGLESLDEQDAAIFFGRDAQTTKGLDALRRMRDGAPERMLVILGASGAGKSSFLKAGLIARLKRDEENFLVLPTVRPERAAVSGERGLAVSLSSVPEVLTRPEDVVEAFLKLRATVVDRMKRYAASAHESLAAKLPTIVIPIDQAEELFAAEAAEGMLELLVPALLGDGNAVIVATIRSDSFEKLQTEPRLADVPVLPFSLGPIPHGAFKDVIECPARLTNPPISIEPALTERLLRDLADDDALPLLAFTLERLLNRTRGRPTLTLANYASELGGLQGAITAAVDAAFASAARDASLPSGRAELERLARSAFIPALVQIDDADSEPRRRVEKLTAFPEATRTLVRRFVDERLLVCDRREVDGVASDMVEVAHEAILRQWPALKSWISEERDALRALDGVRTAAAEWRKHATRDGEIAARAWLIHRGARLEEAEALLARPDFAAALSKEIQEYIAACRVNENSENLRERQSLARTRRLQRRIWILVGVAGLFVLLAGLAAVQMLAGIATEAADVLTAEAAKASEAGDYEAAVRYAVAAVNRVYGLPNFQGSANAEAEIRGASTFMRIVAVLYGHAHWVTDASFSPDGRRIVTSSRDKTARIWDARAGAQMLVLRGHTDAVLSARFSPDGKRIVTSSEDGTARVWDAATGAQLKLIRGHSNAVISAGFSPDGRWIVTGSADKTARVWDSVTGAQHSVLRGHQDTVTGVSFSRDGKHIVTASADKTAGVWDFATNRQIAVFRGHEASVESASFSPDGKHVATASDDKTVRIWYATTGRQLALLGNHEGAVNSVMYSPDGTRLVTASEDKTARLWNALTGQQIATLYGHKDPLLGAAFSPDSSRVVTASEDKTARVWNASGGKLIVLRGHLDWVNSARFSPDGKRVATASNDKTVRVWDAASGQQLWQASHDNLVESVEFSPDGKRIVSGSDDGTARIWDTNTGRQLTILQGHHDKVYDAAFSRDGNQIAIAFTDGRAIVLDLSSSRKKTFLGHHSALTSAKFSPDGRQIVTSSRDGTARIWDAASGTCAAVLRGHSGAVTSAAYSSDGKRIVTAGADGMAVVWDVQSRRKLITLNGHQDQLRSAAFSSDGTRILTASKDRTARIWDATTGREIAVLRGHQSQVESASFSFNGTQVVTASDDGTARIWTISGMNAATASALIQSTCRDVLAGGLSRFSGTEVRAAGVLDAQIDGDACRPATPWARVGRIFWAGISK